MNSQAFKIDGKVITIKLIIDEVIYDEFTESQELDINNPANYAVNLDLSINQNQISGQVFYDSQTASCSLNTPNNDFRIHVLNHLFSLFEINTLKDDFGLDTDFAKKLKNQFFPEIFKFVCNIAKDAVQQEILKLHHLAK
ncbi:hypothetical protein E6P75_12450 [Moraxella osloensis]|uniref:Uncharacterized protein n=1 Tax=Faucicola osloensis TaxID=34062 RepID=A0AAW6THK8_FAUOS|nr:hypothetical protein [Moraxella osloensis]MDI4510998.1 hypothetical protein [Moraxella osloensis]